MTDKPLRISHAPACPWPEYRCTCGAIKPEDDLRRGDWMQTFTGRAFYPLDPRVEDIDPEDIAHALSMLCRYNGQTKFFYSVAEHCVLMSEWVESVAGPYDALWTLLHDASEAYMGDMVRPLKRSMPSYRAAEDNLMAFICTRFGINVEVPPIVKEADNRILMDERAKLMTKPPMPWTPDEAGLESLGVEIGCWTPARARNEYWTRLTRLRQQLPRMEKP